MLQLDANLNRLLKSVSRQMLHAHRLVFVHPETQKPMAFEAPIPDDMQTLIDQIKKGGSCGNTQSKCH